MDDSNGNGFLGTLIIDELPPDWDSTGVVTRVSDNEVVLRGPTLLWVAKNLTLNVLDAEVVE